MKLTPQKRARFEELLARYPVKRSALLTGAHLVQEQEGWLSREAIKLVASLLGYPRPRSTTPRASTPCSG